MPDYVVNLTGSAQVDATIIQEFSQQVLVTHGETGTADQFISLKEDIGAESVRMPIYSRLGVVETPLLEREETQSEALVDTGLIITPEEFGKVVTRTSLSSLQTGGKVDLAAAQLVGINMAQSENRLALIAADASTNVVLGGSAGTVATVGPGDVMTGAIADKLYNKLSRASVPGLPSVMGSYVAIAHDDVLTDIRNSAGFESIKKYANASELSRNIIGFYKGFFWVRDNLSTIGINAGAPVTGSTATEVYNTYFLGFNGLGKGTTLAPHLRVTGPFDKLARFANIGWYGVLKYKIIQPEALWVAKTSSSVAP